MRNKSRDAQKFVCGFFDISNVNGSLTLNLLAFVNLKFNEMFLFSRWDSSEFKMRLILLFYNILFITLQKEYDHTSP